MKRSSSSSKKRSSSTSSTGKRRATTGPQVTERDVVAEEPEEFEDPYSDIEDDGEVVDAGGDDEEFEEGEEDDQDEQATRQVFRPGVDMVPEGYEMTYDSSAYDMYHKLQVDWPCLSFDIVTDSHGASRTKYPITCYWACGSQAGPGSENYVGLMKSSQLCRTKFDGDDDSDAEDPDDDDDNDDEEPDLDPVLETKFSKDPSSFNRIRTLPQQPTIVAGWTEAGVIKCWDFSDQFRQLDDPAQWVRENAEAGGAKAGKAAPLLFSTPHTAEGHLTEGFGLGWSPLKRGSLASGDCDGFVRVWTLADTGTISCSNLTPTPSAGSIEDIKWSSTQETVFIAALSGGLCQVFDTRSPGPKLSWSAGPKGVDVNVLDWNPHKQSSHLVVTGSDDGSFHIWNLQSLSQTAGKSKPLQSYTYLQAPITSIEWSPTNENLVAVASDDNQVTLWDFSVERDREEELALAARHPELAKFPAQVVFQHMGVESPKELHWHPQLPGVVVVTDSHGFDIFRPSNWKSIIR